MKSVLFLHWAPRVLGIIAILFISMFSLDVFQSGMPLKDVILGWFVHMIPSIVLTIILIIAWKWEKIGGIIFLSIGLAFSPVIFWGNYTNNHSIWMSLVIIITITFPLIITGILFLMSHHTKQQAREMLKGLKRDT